jgi:uncharacterized protein YqgQ
METVKNIRQFFRYYATEFLFPNNLYDIDFINIQVSKYPFIIINYRLITVKRIAQGFALFTYKVTQTNLV